MSPSYVLDLFHWSVPVTCHTKMNTLAPLPLAPPTAQGLKDPLGWGVSFQAPYVKLAEKDATGAG